MDMSTNNSGFTFDDLLENADTSGAKESAPPKKTKKPAVAKAKPAKVESKEEPEIYGDDNGIDSKLENSLAMLMSGNSFLPQSSYAGTEEPEQGGNDAEDAPAKKGKAKGKAATAKKNTKKKNEDIAADRKVINEIKNGRFGKQLEDLGYKLGNMQDKTPEQLKDLIEQLQATIATRDAGKGCESIILGLISGIEQFMSRRTKYNISGMTARLQKDEDFLDLVEELRIKWIARYSIGPEWRMAFKLFMVSSSQYEINTMGNGGGIQQGPAHLPNDEASQAVKDKMDKLEELLNAPPQNQ